MVKYLGKKDKKGKKGKKDKDPTSNRSIESLWEELVQQQIIIPVGHTAKMFLKNVFKKCF